MRDPKDYCIICARRYGATEEYCSGCGFNYCDNPEDEVLQNKAVALYNAETFYEDER